MTDDPPFLAWLKDPATHGLPAGAEVTVMQTPCCWVVLAGERAIKVKKPVDFGFLDYSTLEKRRATLEEELRLNRRTAPDIYLRVVDITRQADGFTFDGAGAPVEAALVMKRFPQEKLLSRICEREGVSDALAEALGEAIAAFHRAEPPVWDSGVEAMERHVRSNTGALRATAAVFEDGAAERLIKATDAAITAHRGLIEARAAAGFVRHLHGDLHLENIFVDERGRPTLFDAMEFDAKLATTDLMLDIAFTLMDLVHRGQPRAANRTLNVWLDRMARAEEGGLGLAGADGLALLPLCLSIRAAVRAHVRARLALSLDGAERALRAGEARSYLGHAIRWLSPPEPRLLAVGGRSGTGKSTLAKALAVELGGPAGAVIVRTDEVRKRLHGVPPDEPLPRESYTPDSHARVYAGCFDLARRALAAGSSVIVDAAFLDAAERGAAREAAGDVRFIGLWLDAAPDILVSRVSTRLGDASDADAAVVRHQLARDVGPIEWTVVDAGGSPDDTLAKARAALG
jgi:aminoglycoside phosphotransferase family enzyme/predicted kinase